MNNNKLPVPVVCQCGFATLDAHEANKHLKECPLKDAMRCPDCSSVEIRENPFDNEHKYLCHDCGNMF